MKSNRKIMLATILNIHEIPRCGHTRSSRAREFAHDPRGVPAK